MKKQRIAGIFCIVFMLGVVMTLVPGCAKQEKALVVDVDLTTLSSPVVFAEVNNMMLDPESYVGKTIKAKGLYGVEKFNSEDDFFHYIVIPDATACCSQGLEFVWIGDYSYPNDYPKTDADIEVTGVWESYEENGFAYYRIAASDLAVI